MTDLPSDLTSLSTGARSLFSGAPDRRWSALNTTSSEMARSWERLGAGEIPSFLRTQMDEALAGVQRAVRSRDSVDLCRVAIRVGLAAADLELRYRPTAEVDRGRLGLQARQVQVNAAAGDAGAVLGDASTLETLWNRMRHAASPTDAEAIQASLADLRASAEAGDLGTAGEQAAMLVELSGG